MKDRTITITKSGIQVFFMTLLVFLSMEPFFAWKTVSGFGYRIYTTTILLTTLMMAYSVFLKKRITKEKTVDLDEKRRIPRALFWSSTLVVCLFFYEVFFSGVVTRTQQVFNMAMLCIHLGLMLFVLQDNISLQRVYRAAKKVFALTLIPSIFVFLLLQTGADSPSFSLAADTGKDMVGQGYELYLGVATMIHYKGELLNRLCGIYREPGFVGTIGALFLLSDRMTLRKWENVVILIACFFTFSLAFVVMLVLGILLRAVGKFKRRGNVAAGTALIIAVIIGYFVFMSLPFAESSALGVLQERLVITEDGLVGDNRFGSSQWAEEAYEEFMSGPLSVKLFGFGQDPRVVPGTKVSIWQSVCSYKEFVFGFGFVGLGLLLMGLVLCTYFKFRNVTGSARWKIFVLLLVFLASIYQRYNVSTFFYYCVLFGGAANLALSEPTEGEDAQGS